MPYFVSILVPVYNVAPYIGGLLQQLKHLHDFVPDLELIFVDDGSSDGSLGIIEEAALPNTTVIRHGSNRGLSVARNTLMDAAHGSYVWFLDSDDLISVVHAAELLKTLREAPAECLLFDFLRFKQSDLPTVHIGPYGPQIGGSAEFQATKHLKRSLPPNETVTEREKFLVPYLLDDLHYSWAMIVKHPLLADIRFPENLIFEDQAVTPRLMLSAKSVRYHPVPIVLYRDRSDSLEKQRTYKAAHDAGHAVFCCLAAFGEESANLTEPERIAFGVCLLRSLLWSYKLTRLRQIAKPEAQEMLRPLVSAFKQFIGDREGDALRVMSEEARVLLDKLLSPNSDPQKLYGSTFFASYRDGSVQSAKIVVPLVLQLVRGVSSVVDVGCGTGGWLSVFKENGVARVRGLDGGAAMENGQLKIEPEEFTIANFERPLEIDDRFDLCVCLELAEHLTGQGARRFVKTLCDLADVILFSAALPGQGGRDHVNEQWPSYWTAYFEAAGYRPYDIVRGPLWYDTRLEWWYRQNLLLFANKSGASKLSVAEGGACTPLDVVHPDCFQSKLEGDSPVIKIRRAKADREFAAMRRRNKAALKERQKTIARLQRENRRLNKRLSDINNSTSWKLTYPFRHISHRGIRRVLRRLAYGGWAIVSLRVFGREKTSGG